MTYIDTSDTGQGAKLNNQDIFGCLFLCLKYPIAKGFCIIALLIASHEIS